ncbi:MAG: HAMP domain-containing sensor histidine kinase [Rhodoferax sp.]|uniref:sensor histidine kinase n=1 Tax=Rhodoferax sp. TaxID=50421 RepID=UPI003264074A
MPSWHWRKTLVARVVAVVVLAVALAGVAVALLNYWQFKQAMATESGLQHLGRYLTPALADIRNPQDAITTVVALESVVNASRREAAAQGLTLAPCLFQLRDDKNQLLYSSAQLGPQTLLALGPKVSEQTIAGKLYRVVQTDLPRWSVRIAEPKLADTTVLQVIANDLLPALLLALPVALLPIWLAVRQGLKPLQRLSTQLQARSPNDLCAVSSDLKYAELNAVANAFNAVLGQLRDKMQREHAFVQDAAHELRTPMAVISAQAHLLVQAATDPQRQQAQAGLEQAIQRASHLAHQLLALAALDQPGPTPAQRTDVAALLRNTLAALAPAAMARNMDISLEAPDQLFCTLDAAALQSIVQNLLDNAVRYGHDGGRIAMSLHADGDGRQLRLQVADDGPGIPDAEQAHIFERFVRGSQQQAAGSGLGLAIARQAALALHGQITLGPGLDGNGATFTLTARI